MTRYCVLHAQEVSSHFAVQVDLSLCIKARDGLLSTATDLDLEQQAGGAGMPARKHALDKRDFSMEAPSCACKEDACGNNVSSSKDQSGKQQSKSEMLMIFVMEKTHLHHHDHQKFDDHFHHLFSRRRLLKTGRQV